MREARVGGAAREEEHGRKRGVNNVVHEHERSSKRPAERTHWPALFSPPLSSPTRRPTRALAHPTCTVHIWRKSRSASCHCPPRSSALMREQQVTTSASMRLACKGGGKGGGGGWVGGCVCGRGATLGSQACVPASNAAVWLNHCREGLPSPSCSQPAPPGPHLHVLEDLQGCVPLLALGQG